MKLHLYSIERENKGILEDLRRLIQLNKDQRNWINVFILMNEDQRRRSN